MKNVYWNPETGATCPACGAGKVAIKSSPCWEDGIKIRRHKCECGATFKSIQFSREAMTREVKQCLAEVEKGIRSLDEQRERLHRILNYA